MQTVRPLPQAQPGVWREGRGGGRSEIGPLSPELCDFTSLAMYLSLYFFFLRNGADSPVWFTQMPPWTPVKTLATHAAERFANHKAGHFVLRLFQALSCGVDTAWCLLRWTGTSHHRAQARGQGHIWGGDRTGVRCGNLTPASSQDRHTVTPRLYRNALTPSLFW